jgi:hypothetical protein
MNLIWFPEPRLAHEGSKTESSTAPHKTESSTSSGTDAESTSGGFNQATCPIGHRPSSVTLAKYSSRYFLASLDPDESTAPHSNQSTGLQ